MTTLDQDTCLETVLTGSRNIELNEDDITKMCENTDCVQLIILWKSFSTI